MALQVTPLPSYGRPRPDRTALLRIYRTMFLSRRIDDKEIQLKRQNKIYFQISGAGHEAILVAAGHGAAPGPRLVLRLLPRPRAHAAARDDRRPRCSWARSGAKDDPSSGGRQMPSHWGHAPPQHRDQVLAHRHAVPAGRRLRRGGLPLAARERRARRTRSSTARPATAPRPRASSGRASTPPATASCRSLYLVEDNGYAISVPVEVQTAGGSISKLVRVLPGPAGARGGRLRSRWPAWPCMREAVAYCRARRGPALVHAHVIRPYSHSLSDDETLYRSPAERAGGRAARSAACASRACLRRGGHRHARTSSRRCARRSTAR